MSTTSDLIDQIVTAIAINHSTIDLRDRVVVGMFEVPPNQTAYAWIHPTEISSGEGASVRDWSVLGGVEIRIFAPVANATPKTRIYAALDAVSDVQRAIWNAMVGTPSAPAITVAAQTVSSAVYDGSVLGGQALGLWGIASINLTYTMHTVEGRI